MDRLGQLVQWGEWEWERVAEVAPAAFPTGVEHHAMNSDVEFSHPRTHVVEPATTYRTMPP
eukprot:869622-Lingulodinium_polyedra.AAC.1